MECNIANRLRSLARRMPYTYKRAVVFPDGRDAAGRVRYAHLTFRQLDRESDRLARGFERIGITRGTKTLLMVKPSLDFFSITFALFKCGAVPVLIDPGMGTQRLLECIQGAAPEALIGIPKAHVARLLYGKYFTSIKTCVTVGRRWLWGGSTLAECRDLANEPYGIAPTSADELAAVLFTSGSTGPAKGVEYEHGMFDHQCTLLQKTFGMAPEDIDLPTFPLFALFSVTLGMTAVIPDMDPTRPAQVDPRKIVEAIHNQGCTFSFGSPALWNRVTQYCLDNSITLPSLRQVLLAGAPVPDYIHERFQKILGPDANTNTPYGATESLPVASITGREVLSETAAQTRVGKGICVGQPVPGMTVEIIPISDSPIAMWQGNLPLPRGTIGEIVVKGKTVTKRYHGLEQATTAHKIQDGESVWHRIGDVGYRDEIGRLWFCGRKSHRVETEDGVLYTVCCEAIFNQHESVYRSALVGIGKTPHQVPILIVEPHMMPAHDAERERLTQELLTLGEGNELTRTIRRVLFHPAFPVDVRHNAKINREQLALWAEGQ